MPDLLDSIPPYQRRKYFRAFSASATAPKRTPGSSHTKSHRQAWEIAVVTVPPCVLLTQTYSKDGAT